MSSPLAIAGVSAVLCDLLNNGLIDNNMSGEVGTDVLVTASAPDVITVDGPNAKTLLNLFLHQVTPNPGWRNVGLPSRDSNGARLTNQPLALDLHYLLTAYGAGYLQAEILLGYAMHLLHETPILSRAAIRTALARGALDGSILPPAFRDARASDLAEQVEQIKITPASLSSEEMSRLWSALQARYRPTAAYQVSVVLIEGRYPVRGSLPVLSRGPVDPDSGHEQGVTSQPDLVPPYPTLDAIELPRRQAAAHLGDEVKLLGHNLSGENIRVRFEHPLLNRPLERIIDRNPDPTSLTVALPETPPAEEQWAAGAYMVSVSLAQPGRTPGGTETRSSNSIPLLLAPRLDLSSGKTTATRESPRGRVTIRLALSPAALPGQRISLNCAGQEAIPAPFAAPTNTLEFAFPAELPGGLQRIRLRIDGADSPLVDRSTTPPRFDPSQQVEIPA